MRLVHVPDLQGHPCMVILFGVILLFNIGFIGHHASHTVFYCIWPHTKGRIIAHILRCLLIDKNAMKKNPTLEPLAKILDYL